LGDAQRMRSACEVQGVGGGEEVGELLQLHNLS
jgi:hypothetical protein